MFCHTDTVTSGAASRRPRQMLASAIALAVALAGGTLAVSAIATSPAMAQNNRAQSNSRAFVQVYNPIRAVVADEAADLSTVAGQFPAMVAAAANPADKLAAGQLLLQAGLRARNPAWQRQGLDLQIESGLLPPENVGMFNWFAGNLAFEARDYAAARAALQRAAAANYTEGDVTGLLAETYYQSGDVAGGVAFIRSSIARNVGAGQAVPEQWLLRGLQATYGARLIGEANELAALLVTHHPTRENWQRSLQVVNAMNELEPQTRLDLLRLMRATGTLTDRSEYALYIESADPRIMSNEVAAVLAEAVASGELSTSDAYYVEINDIVADRVAGDRADAPELVAEARAADGGRLAMLAGDVLFSIEDYAGAEEMFAMALAKGGVDTDMLTTRLGIAQALQGKSAAAQATLGQVRGPRALIASLWSVYAGTRNS